MLTTMKVVPATSRDDAISMLTEAQTSARVVGLIAMTVKKNEEFREIESWTRRRISCRMTSSYPVHLG